MPPTRVENTVAEIRQSRGLSASDVATRLGVRRQTIYAIESGAYVPNTELALKLARELGVPVDRLFVLREHDVAQPPSMSAQLLSTSLPRRGQTMRLCQVDDRWVGVPLSPAPVFLSDGDGVVDRVRRRTLAADIQMVSDERGCAKRLALAGCDPAMGLLAATAQRDAGIELVIAQASSTLALQWLVEGKVHIAGSHLHDTASGDYNIPFLQSHFPAEDFVVVTFAGWEEGLVAADGNPKQIGSVEDLSRKELRFINREPGSGSRSLLDRLLKKAGTTGGSVNGYRSTAAGHLAAAYAVSTGEADACLATRSAANALGLSFIPLEQERYDFVMRRGTAELPAVKTFLDLLQRAALRRKLELLAGYDTSETGKLRAMARPSRGRARRTSRHSPGGPPVGASDRSQ
jgi:molybdate-binding protein/DNA-binding XRE family transcriptional regulator